jgi:autotransporter translocation and assembly factor TamB
LKRRLRNVAQVLLGIMLGAGIAVLGAVGYLRTEAGRARLRVMVLARVRASVPDFDFTRLGGDLTQTIVLERVRLLGGVTAERITVRYRLLALVSRVLQVDELTVAGGRADVAGGRARFTAAAHLRWKKDFVRVSLDRLEVAGLPGAARVQLRGDAAGPPSDVAVDLLAELPRPGGRIRMGGTVSATAGTWRLTALSGQVGALRVHASGRGDTRALALTLDATSRGALPLAPVRGHLDLHARAFGPWRQLAVHARGRGHNLVAGNLHIGRFALTADVSHLPSAPRGDLHIVAHALVLTGATAPPGDVTLAVRSDGSALSFHASATRAGAHGALAGRARLRPYTIAVELDQLALEGEGRRIALLRPTRLEIRRGSFAVTLVPTLVQLSAPDWSADVTASTALTGSPARPHGHIELSTTDLRYRALAGVAAHAAARVTPEHAELTATATRAGQPAAALRATSDVALAPFLRTHALADLPFTAHLEVPQLDLAELCTRGAGLGPHHCQGVLRASADLTGPLTHPHGHAQAELAALAPGGVALGPIRAEARLDDRSVHAELRAPSAAGGHLHAHATYALDTGALAGDLHAERLRLEAAGPLLPRLRDLGGRLDADVELHGTASSPRLTGRVALHGGAVGVAGQPTFRDVELALALAEGQVEVHNLHARSNGSLDGRGRAELDGLAVRALHLDARASGFVVAIAGVTTRLDGAFVAEIGPAADGALAGHLDVPAATIWLPRVASPRRLQRIRPHADLSFVDRAGRAEREHQNERHNVAGGGSPVQIEASAPRVLVRSRDVNLTVDARAQVDTNGSGRPVITGVVNIPYGSIAINQQSFTVGHGHLVFHGEPGFNPTIDVQLRRQYGDHTALIQLRGTFSDPELTFASEPPDLDPAQVVGFIMTGGPLLGDPSTANFNVAGAIATSILARLADQIAPQLGIDVLRVSSDIAPDPTHTQPFSGTAADSAGALIEVGKYLTPRLLVSFVHVLGADDNQNQNEGRAEYRVTDRWVVKTVFGDAGLGAVDFLWTWRH